MNEGIDLKTILRLLYGWEMFKQNCTHPETIVHYRDGFAVGDIVCWKEFCNVCNSMVERESNSMSRQFPTGK